MPSQSGFRHDDLRSGRRIRIDDEASAYGVLFLFLVVSFFYIVTMVSKHVFQYDLFMIRLINGDFNQFSNVPWFVHSFADFDLVYAFSTLIKVYYVT